MTMTDKEAWELEEKFASGNILTSGKPGTLARQKEFLKLLDDVSTNYIMTIAEHDRKTPAEVISDMVQERLAATV
ncbi:hypothetical protein AGMMS50268_05950 [Spirochaetia bacterium]|nr:hypothetical protein AGMMS50268_05950 [Spirochaetia bacterium]